MEPISAGILAGGGLLASLGQAIFGAEQAKRAATMEAISGFGQSQQSAMAEGAEKKKAALSTLIDAYRASLGE